jgi:hypothetical protein
VKCVIELKCMEDEERRESMEALEQGKSVKEYE